MIIGKLIPAGTGVAANEQIYLHGRAEELGIADDYDDLFNPDAEGENDGESDMLIDGEDDIFSDAVYGDPDADYPDYVKARRLSVMAESAGR